MNIIEDYSRGKYDNEELNEDGLYIEDNFIVVVDGATSVLKNQNPAGKKGGRLARELVLNYFETCDYRKKAHQVFDELAALFVERQKQYDEKLKASVCVYSKYYKELWTVGDCQIMLDGEVQDTHLKVDTTMAELRSFIINSLIIQGKYTEEELLLNDVSKDIVFDLIAEYQSALENTSSDYAYTVLNGYDLVVNPNIRSLKDEKEIIIASDGYPELKRTLHESELRLSQINDSDPLCFRENKQAKGMQPGMISFDDRTYVKFRR